MSVYRRDPFSHHLAPPLWRTRADSVPPFSEQCLNNLCRLNFLPIRFYEIGYAIIVYGIVWFEPRRKKNCDFILVDGKGIYALTRNLTIYIIVDEPILAPIFRRGPATFLSVFYPPSIPRRIFLTAVVDFWRCSSFILDMNNHLTLRR